MNLVSDGQSPPDPQPGSVPVILANLSLQIQRPLGQLHRGIDTLLADAGEDLSDVERAQAETMIQLCLEIDQLTRSYLDRPVVDGA